MTDLSKILIWPMADGRDVAVMFGSGLFMLAGAVLLEMRRRRQERNRFFASERRALVDLFEDREVEGDEKKLVMEIVEKYAAGQPYRFGTRRHVFDECMDRYFTSLSETADEETIAQRGAQLRDVRTRLGLDYVPLGQRILSTRELYSGQALWACPASGREPRWFQLKVTSVDEASFHVTPVGSDGAPDFQPGDAVKFRLWREDDARYLFEARIAGRESDPLAWRVDHAVSLTRSQARAHYRIRFDDTVHISILNAPLGDRIEGLETSPPVTQMYGRITSLSGGGLAVSFQQPMPKQMVMRVPFKLPGLEQTIVAHVRPTGAQNVGGGRSLVRGKFVGMDEETRDAITRYVFLKQKQSAGDDPNQK